MVQVVCPHCKSAHEIENAAPGSLVDCPGCARSWRCGHSVMAEVPPVTAIGRASAPAEVQLMRSGGAALVATLLFYALVVHPLAGSYAGEIFGQRGWVPYVITFFSFWSAALLLGKYRKLSLERRALEVDLLPRELSDRITPKGAGPFLAHLDALPAALADTFVAERLRRGLDHFAARARVAETVEQLRSQAESDAGAMESSYTMLRTFIWAIPILGFIGTVIGIGASVAGFSEAVSSAADLEVVKTSIGSVTTGLGVAFDTTLLALVMSIFIMLPASSLQKAEEDFLTRVDDYCRHHLVARLDDRQIVVREEPSIGALQNWADRLADELLAALERRRAESV